MMANRRGTTRRLVSGADLLMHSGRYIGMVGDLDVPPVAVLNDALAKIAMAGFHTRIGLVPESHTRIWRSSRSPIEVRPVPPEVSARGAQAVLEYIRRRPGERAPLEVHVSDRHIAVDTDHGLGDGRLFVDLTSSLLALARGESVPWVEKPDTRLALPRALFTTFARQPTRLRTAWVAVKELRATKPQDPPPVGQTTEWAPSLAVRVIHLSDDVESTFNAWRREHVPTTASGASWMYAVFRALQRAGLPMTEKVRVAVDARRYLPKGSSANGNFIAGIEIPLTAQDSVTSAGQRVRQLTDSALPLVVMGMVSAVTAIRGSSSGGPPSEVQQNVPASLMYSDLGRLATLHGAHWLPDGPRSLSGLLDPSGPDGITVLNSSIHGGRCISITFHDNVFDRQIIDRAAKLLEGDPVDLLVDRPPA